MNNLLNPNSPSFSIILMILLFGLMYMLLIRPQRKREKEEQAMRAALKVGDEVVTIGGVVGKVEKITDRTVIISTTAGKNRIEFLKSSVATLTKSSQSAGSAKETAKAAPEEKAPNRDKKVTPKKLGKKAEEETDK